MNKTSWVPLAYKLLTRKLQEIKFVTNVWSMHRWKEILNKNALQSKANRPLVLILLTAVTLTLTL